MCYHFRVQRRIISRLHNIKKCDMLIFVSSYSLQALTLTTFQNLRLFVQYLISEDPKEFVLYYRSIELELALFSDIFTIKSEWGHWDSIFRFLIFSPCTNFFIESG